MSTATAANAAAVVDRLRLDGELTVYRAAELKPLLLPLPNGLAPVEIDLSGVSEIDTAGLQLLLLAQREAGAMQRPLRLVGHSRAVDDALTLLDLHRLLGADAAADADAACD